MLRNIIEVIKDKGWNLYKAENDDTLENIIARGPSEQIEEGSQYIFFPQVSNPKDANAIGVAMMEVLDNKKYPTIRYENQTLPIAILQFKGNYVVIGHIRNLHLHRNAFYDSIETLPSVKKL